MLIRRPTIFVGILSLAICLGVFRIKYTVMALEQQHRHVKRAISENQEAIHVLRAEWHHLNSPERLQKLAIKYLDIGPQQSPQVGNLKDVAGQNSNNDRAALENLIAQAVADSAQSPEDHE